MYNKKSKLTTMKRKFYTLLFVSTLWGITPVWAQVEDENTRSPVVMEDGEKDLFSMSLEELMNVKVVSASRKEETLADAPSNITVVTAKQIKEWGSRDIKDVVRRIAGFQVIADRDEWVFAARGNVSDNNQKYLILIDGHRMNSIENFGPGNIIEMPNNLSNVKQIEVIKGPGSAVWGADALAGVINIITKDVSDLNGQNIQGAVNYGEGNLQVADFQIGHEIDEKNNIMVMGSFSQQDGKLVKQSAATGWPILDTDTPKQNLDGVATKPGEYTTALDRHNFGYMLQMKATLDKFKINAYAFETDVHNRHFEVNKGRENSLSTYKTFIEAQYDNTFFKDLQFNWKVSSDLNQAEYRPVSQQTNTNVSNITWRDRGIFTAMQVRKPLVDKILNLNSGMDYKFTKAGPNTRIDNFGADSVKNKATGYWIDNYLEDHQIGGYGLLELTPNAKINITAGLRADYNKQRGADHFNMNPRFSAIYKFSEFTTFKALYNRGYLRPANYQISPNVKSEKMNQVDVIFMQRINRFNYTVTLYWQKLEGFILLQTNNVFANTGDYTSKGVEVDFNYIISDKTSLWGNASLSDPKGNNFASNLAYDSRRVDLNGKLLSYSPFTSNLGFTQRFLQNKLFVSPAVRYVHGTKYRIASVAKATDDKEAYYNTTPNYAFLDLSLGYEPNEKLGFYIYADNLLNETGKTNLSVWNGSIGQYGRQVSFKVRFRF